MENFYEKIELYLEGEMTKAEMQAFEEQLHSNPALQEEVAMHRKVRSSLATQFQNEVANEATEKTLQSLGEKFFSREKKKESTVVVMFRKYGTAAIVVAAMLVLILWVPRLISPPSLYEQYAHHPIAEFTQKGNTSQGLLLQQAEKAFNQENFENALNSLNQILAETPDDIRLQFYKGICQLEINQNLSAVATFQTIATGTSLFNTEAKWYLALIYLKMEDWGKCKRSLEMIPIDSGRYGDARKLLENLP